jgi:hypothetical protein
MQKFIITGSTLSARYCEVKVKAQQMAKKIHGLGAIVSGSGNAVGTYNRAFPLKPVSVKGFGR